MRLRLLVLSVACAAFALAPSAAAGAGQTTTVMRARGDGLGAVHFGERARRAEHLLASKFGQPHRRFRKTTAGCNVSATTEWPKFTAYYDKGKLVGYQYLGVRSGVLVHGPRGLHVGETLRRAQRREGARFHRSLAQGGSWSLRTAHGRLIGYLTSEHRSARILSIDAGHVGCPAETP